MTRRPTLADLHRAAAALAADGEDANTIHATLLRAHPWAREKLWPIVDGAVNAARRRAA